MARNLQGDPKNRDVRLYDNNGTLLGGLHWHVHAWTLFYLQNDGSTGQHFAADESQLVPGNLVVLGHGGQSIPVSLTSDSAPRRVPSPQASSSMTSSVQHHFRDALRERDNGCTLSGAVPNPIVPFATLKAAHVYPVAREGRWIARSYNGWITDSRPAMVIGTSKIHSPQNGLLLDDTVHTAFDLFLISVDPGDGYKIVDFSGTYPQVHGRVLSATATNPPNNDDRICDNVLRWHFEQAVLTNMRGVGEKPWEFDFGGGDEIGAIMADEDAAERMEVELFTRLGAGDTEV